MTSPDMGYSEYLERHALHEELVQRIDHIIAVSRHDPEAGHLDEDDLILGLAYQYCPEKVVSELKRLQAANLIRWYA